MMQGIQKRRTRVVRGTQGHSRHWIIRKQTYEICNVGPHGTGIGSHTLVEQGGRLIFGCVLDENTADIVLDNSGCVLVELGLDAFELGGSARSSE